MAAAGSEFAKSFAKDYNVGKSNSRTKEKTITKTAPSAPIVIYRYYSSKTENLAPRENKDYDGLSFSTIPPKANQLPAVMTTIEKINSTGTLLAIQNGTHITVVPTNGTVISWMAQGQNSQWSKTLSSIVVEWDGVN